MIYFNFHTTTLSLIMLCYKETLLYDERINRFYFPVLAAKSISLTLVLRDLLMITAATKQMLEAHCCCPLRHRGLLIPSWIHWPGCCRLSFGSHGNLHLSGQRSKRLVTKDGSRKHTQPPQLLLWLMSGEKSTTQWKHTCQLWGLTPCTTKLGRWLFFSVL